ncbi:SIR2 family protein [Sorangium sp. So ce1335]|uniref:SIR2 family protein n=1 Tax=Sorangium sp. So ce1335 TaxID=3133335 RepID=UPI003F622B32
MTLKTEGAEDEHCPPRTAAITSIAPGVSLAAVDASDPLIEVIREAYEARSLVIFAGSGVTAAAGLPAPGALAAAMSQRARGRGAEPELIAEIDQLIEQRRLFDAFSALQIALGPVEFAREISVRWSDDSAPVPGIARAIAALSPRLRAVLSTNLNKLFERAFRGHWDVYYQPTGDMASRSRYLFKLHGTLAVQSTWVVTREHRERLLHDALVQEAVAALLSSFPVLVVGCDLATDHDGVLERLRARAGAGAPARFAVVPRTMSSYQRSELQRAGLQLLYFDPGAEDEVGAVTALLHALDERAPRDSAAVVSAPAPSPPRAEPSGERPSRPSGERATRPSGERPSDADEPPSAARRGAPSRWRGSARDQAAASRELRARPNEKRWLRSTSAYLMCDREAQWARLKRACGEAPRAHVFVLSGDMREGHAYFLKRVAVFGRSELDADPVEVRHDIYQMAPHDVAAKLRDYLRERDGTVAAAISRRLECSNLILLFPRVRIAQQGAWLREFYTKALPDLIARVEEHGPPRHSLIALQPVTFRAGFLDRVCPFSGRRRVERFVEALAGVRRPSLEVHAETLSRIDSDHVKSLLDDLYGSDPALLQLKLAEVEEFLDLSTADLFSRLEEITK